MPELPEVETMVRDLARRVLGLRIIGIDAPFQGSVAWPSYEEFYRRALGRRLDSVSRRGKYGAFGLDSGDLLIVHRGMTGSLLARRAGAPLESHVRMVFCLEDNIELRFTDQRKFGKIFLMAGSGEERPLPWARMGPEPLNGLFTPEALTAGLSRRTGLIKPLLLNQQLVAGLGNIYVDEALFRAGIHPERRAHTLTDQEIGFLHNSIRDILREAVERRGTTFSTYTDIEGRAGGYQHALRVFHRAGQPCHTCGTTIQRLVVGGRGTHICPACQKA